MVKKLGEEATGMDTAKIARPSFPRTCLTSDVARFVYFSLFKFVLHMLFYGNYGYFRDELYFFDCADHLAWGYVDQPPLPIFILKVVRWLFGDSLLAIRFPCAVAGAIVVFLTGKMVRQLGGGRFAQVRAAIAPEPPIDFWAGIG